MFKKLFLSALAFSLFSCNSFADNLQQKAKLWTAISLQGPLSKNNKIQYYLEPQLRFISRSESFDQAVLHVGLGYPLTPTLIVWLGNTWADTNNPGKENEYQYRIWQQLTWDPVDKNLSNFSSRTRLEQRKDHDNEEWSLRLRQKLTLTIPLHTCGGYDFVIFDELFFNLNNPSWVNNTLIDQNRAFIGLSIPLSKKMDLEAGYLNQYVMKHPDQMAHVLSLKLKV